MFFSFSRIQIGSIDSIGSINSIDMMNVVRFFITILFVLMCKDKDSIDTYVYIYIHI